MHELYEDLGVLDLNDNDNDNNNPSSIRILQVTDLHIFPRECASFQGIPLLDSYSKCLKLIDTLVLETTPDVIMLTGDILDGRGPWKSSDRVTEVIQDMIPNFHNVPWAFLPGNHDDDNSPWTREDLTKIFQLDGCIQRQAKGFHNTILLTKNKKVRVRLHMFDSGGNHPDKKIMYYCTPSRAIEGFTESVAAAAMAAAATKDGKATTHDDNDDVASNTIPALVYLHIPTPEYQGLDPVIGHNYLFDAALRGGKIPSPFDKLAWLVKLLKKDRIAGCTRGSDTGLFPALVNANETSNNNNNSNIVAMFCGHDHHSDAIFRRDNIFLGYGRSGSMTPPYDWEGKAPNPLRPGARVVEVVGAGGDGDDDDVHDGVGETRVTTWIQTGLGVEGDSFLDMTSYNASQERGCWP